MNAHKMRNVHPLTTDKAIVQSQLSQLHSEKRSVECNGIRLIDLGFKTTGYRVLVGL